jgi:hypothetical protein
MFHTILFIIFIIGLLKFYYEKVYKPQNKVEDKTLYQLLNEELIPNSQQHIQQNQQQHIQQNQQQHIQQNQQQQYPPNYQKIRAEGIKINNFTINNSSEDEEKSNNSTDTEV